MLNYGLEFIPERQRKYMNMDALSSKTYTKPEEPVRNRKETYAPGKINVKAVSDPDRFIRELLLDYPGAHIIRTKQSHDRAYVTFRV